MPDETEETTQEEFEYKFEGFDVDFSQKIALTPGGGS